jgi:two-component system chemotaxis response regulator CheY
MEIKALIADSSTKVRKNIMRSLQEIGVRKVVEAIDGDQAVELLEQDTFDVIFAEFDNQSGAGEQLVNSLRELDETVPIIVTAPQSKKIADLKKACPNASNFLTTPFTTEQLRKTVADYVPALAS